MFKVLNLENLKSSLVTQNCVLLKQDNPAIEIRSCILIKNESLLNSGLDISDQNQLYIFNSSLLKSFEYKNVPLLSIIVHKEGKIDIPDKFQNAMIIYSADINSTYNIIRRTILRYYSLRSWKIELEQMLFDNKNLQKIIDKACSTLGNPIIVQSSAFQLLCHSTVLEVDEWLFHDILATKNTPYEVIKHLRTSRFTEVYNSNFPVFVPKDNLIPSDTIATRINLSNQAVGHISLIATARPFGEDDIYYMELLSNVVSRHFQLNEKYKNTTLFTYSNFLSELLENTEIDKRQISEEMKFWNLKLGPILRVLVIRDLFNHRSNIPLFYVLNKIESYLPFVRVFTHKNEIVVVIDGNQDEFTTKKYEPKLKHLLLENHLICGVSQTFNDISLLGDYHKQANVAIDIGRHVSTQKNIIFHYEDYTVDHALNVIAKNVSPLTFCNADILKLLEFDKQNNTDYLFSLYAYVCCGCNGAKAAEIVNIHRNSLDYRLNRIFSMISLDTNKADDLFLILLCIRLLIHCHLWTPPHEINCISEPKSEFDK